MCEFVFDQLRCPILIISPLKLFIFLKYDYQGSNNHAKIFDKTLIEASKTMEALYITNWLWSRPFLYGLDLLFIYKNALLTNNIS